MGNIESMKAGIPFIPSENEIMRMHMECLDKVHSYNQLAPSDVAARESLLREILGKCGKRIRIESPFHCDYGFNIEIGKSFYANFNLVILDVGQVVIGNHVMCGPNVSIYTVGHPLHPETRRSGYEFGRAMSIGDNVWLGGNVVITPGVSIGDNVVVGAGSVVVKSIPDNVLVAGNPARIIREITDADKGFFYKGCPDFAMDKS